MSTEKTVAISFRVSPHFKHLLETAAARENRSQTNMLETLLYQYCKQQGIDRQPSLTKKKKVPAQ